ncbi:hypothetical protein [Pseudovibrio sp. WM33]|uniref:hypothetical protein n=1 Tax=Pseudovibrio sp. WM33 TaxID=1735585 RepID=UPI0007AE89CB|nr:hypothetical protein [Pseudovibrio sp. WM33]KZL18132.1 hypothetical protein PsWM33_05119 [Pseudovibrio sp. WM33]
MIIRDVVKFLIDNGPGRTQRQLSVAIFGSDDRGYQQRVNWECRNLTDNGQVACRGAGGINDPYTYYPVTEAAN